MDGLSSSTCMSKLPSQEWPLCWAEKLLGQSQCWDSGLFWLSSATWIHKLSVTLKSISSSPFLADFNHQCHTAPAATHVSYIWVPLSHMPTLLDKAAAVYERIRLTRHNTYSVAAEWKMTVTWLTNIQALLTSMMQSIKINPAHYTRGGKQEGEGQRKTSFFFKSAIFSHAWLHVCSELQRSQRTLLILPSRAKLRYLLTFWRQVTCFCFI